MSEMTRNRVLIVDDEPSIRLAIRRFLTAAGFEVSDADNRISALTQARKDAFALVKADAGLRQAEHAELRKAVVRQYGKTLDLAEVG